MATKRLFTTICMLTMALCLTWAQGPNNTGTYYENANGESGASLKTKLSVIINGYYKNSKFAQIDYGSGTLKGVWGAFATTDVLSDNKTIRDRYSNITKYIVGDDQGSSSNTENTGGYNREHSFPKSWFGGSTAKGPGTDIHHIYPTDVHVNSMRGNLPYGPNNGETNHSNDYYSKVGACTYPGSNGIECFEPDDEWKGDFARTYFYMVTCYETSLVSWGKAGSTINGTTYPSFTTWALNMLLEWSRNDPVSDIEIARNDAVCAIQHNRNPFIDYPGLEDYIWGDKKNDVFRYDNYEGSSTGKLPVTMSFLPTSVTATLGESFTAPTLSMSPSGLTVTYSSSNTNVATVNASTGAVTLKAVGTTTITASFAGNNEYYANSTTYTLIVKKQGGDDPTPGGETLLWESFSGYTSTSDGSAEIYPSNENLDYKSWTSFTKVFLGKNGTGKLGSGSAVGSMEAKNIALTGSGILTFKVQRYSTDSGKLNVTITGATAEGDLQVTPQSSWTEYTVTLSDAKGSVGIKFATSTKRAYIDDIKLVSVAEEPTTTPGDIVKDGKIDWNDLKALVKILLGITPAGNNIDTDAADVNGDGETYIADVTRLVNKILQNNQ